MTPSQLVRKCYAAYSLASIKRFGTSLPAILQVNLKISPVKGLNYIYTGNAHNKEGDTTFYPECQRWLSERDWYQINQYRLTKEGHCPDCGFAIAGRFKEKAGDFGPRRIPVAINP